MNRLALLVPALLVLGAGGLTRVVAQPAGSVFDIVLVGGRVLDPESGLDAVRNVGIRNGKVAAITTGPLRGRTALDVRGLVVAPGFIDLHTHEHDPESYGFYARDGVTTAIDGEGGAFPVGSWYAEREGKARINYGATVGHRRVRVAVIQGMDALRDSATFRDPSAPYQHHRVTPDELWRIVSAVRQGLAEGAVGIGSILQLTPGTTHEEVLRLFEVAAEQGVPYFVHLRFQGAVEPGSGIAGLEEALAGAAITGASLHIVHLPATLLGQTPIALDIIDRARRRGLDVTTEAFPYTGSNVRISSSVFDPGWQERLGISYAELRDAATGERLTEESFARLRPKGGYVLQFSIPDSAVDSALAHPLVMVASDANPAHPRLAGTHARVLGRYVRERRVLSLMEGVRKMTLLPAQRLERAVPAMRDKGRIRVGADADLTVFDPDRVIDRATYERPKEYSEGIVHVLVNGSFVVRDEALVTDASPGRPIRRPAARQRSATDVRPRR